MAVARAERDTHCPDAVPLAPGAVFDVTLADHLVAAEQRQTRPFARARSFLNAGR
jgi:hypothetical protein